MAAASLGSKVFFAGGYDPYGTGVGAPFCTRVDIYDTATNTWSTANLSVPRTDLTATSVGNKVIFAGGDAGSLNMYATADIYTMQSYTSISSTKAWTLVDNTTVAGDMSLSASGSLNLGTFTLTVGSMTGAAPISLGGQTLSVGADGTSTSYSGAISGSGKLIKSGSGALLLNGSNTYTGGTAVNAGTLQAAGTAALPGYATLGKITVGNGAMLAVSAGGSGWTAAGIGTLLGSNSSGFASGSVLGIDTSSGSLAYNSNIAGSTGLAKLGANTLTLTGSNTYTGPTTISKGKLTVDGSLTNSAVGVTGGTLGGTGYLSGGTVNAGGTLAPGDPLGVLHLSGSLILEQGAVMDYELDTPSTSDEISCASLALNNQQFSDFHFTWSANFGPGSYDLIAFGSSSGSLASASGTIDGYTATLAVKNNDLVLTVVPEPSTFALLAVGVFGLIGWAWRRRRAKTIVRLLLAAALLAPAISARADVFNMGGTRNPTTGTWTGQASLSFVTVGDPGNVPDPATGYGSVPYAYNIGTYDVTRNQYVAFLNAVATTGDPYGLWNSYMEYDNNNGFSSDISPSINGYICTGDGNQPVVFATWYDAIRFANWLSNGQPTAPEGNGTTETGTYLITNGGNNSGTVTLPSAAQRAAWAAGGSGMHYVVPTEDEWYKAAYYMGGGTNSGYWTYPTKSNTAPISQPPPGGTNSANFFDPITGYAVTGSLSLQEIDYFTDVGAYSNSPGPYGTFDQGGNAWEWIEGNEGNLGYMCGGSFYQPASEMASSYIRNHYTSYESYDVGFRVGSIGSVPEPSCLALLLAGAVALGIWRLRRKV